MATGWSPGPIIHRDFKPLNLLLTKDLNLKARLNSLPSGKLGSGLGERSLQRPPVDPLGNIQKAIEHGPFIVDFPIENGDFP